MVWMARLKRFAVASYAGMRNPDHEAAGRPPGIPNQPPAGRAEPPPEPEPGFDPPGNHRALERFAAFDDL